MAGSKGQGFLGSFTTRVILRAILAGFLFPLEVHARDPVSNSGRFTHHQKKSSGSNRPDNITYDSVAIHAESVPSSMTTASTASTGEGGRYATEDEQGVSAYQKPETLAQSSGKKPGHTGTSSASSSTDRVVRRSYEIVAARTGVDQLVDGSSVVTLDGSESRGTGSRALSYEWVQTNGPAVVLMTPNEVSTTFVAPPSNNHPIYLTFELTVGQGMLSARSSVHVVVRPVSLAVPPSDEKVLEWFSSLAPLPKVHYSWPWGTMQLDTMDERLLREYARITHSLCVSGEFVNQAALQKVAALVAEVNDTNPDIPVTLCVVFRPWMRVFPLTEPPTYVGPEHDGEINLFSTRLALVKGWLDEFNEGRSWDPIEISAVLLECERFFVKNEGEAGYEAWNAAITEKQNAIYDAAKEGLPDARVEWYNRGISPLFTLEERGDTFSIPLYSAPLRAVMRTAFRRTVEAAVEHGVAEVTPWVALGSAYIHMPNGSRVWSFDFDYDLIYSWHIGAEINDPWYGDRPTQFAPWHAADVVIFWPRPWEERVPNWPRHFVAYVRGAHNITELPR